MSNIPESSVTFEDQLHDFSWSLYGAIDKTGNTCVSPYSIATVLLFLMLGTRGQSKYQISSAVLKDNQLPDDENFQKFKELNAMMLTGNNGGVELNIATKVFISNRFTLHDDVKAKAKKFFKSDIGHKNFSKSKIAAKFMNTWITKNTNHKIKNLISESWLNSMTVMVLVNAVYFKGEWETKFDPSKTKKQLFFVDKIKVTQVNMMHIKLRVLYTTDNDYSAIALPYRGNKFEMVFILPKTIDGLNALEANISSELLQHINSRFKMSTVQISIPKFVIESELDLMKVLPKLGITDIFNEAKSDFSHLIKEHTGNIYVSKAVHKVIVEVNEEGTEASAATVIVVLLRGGQRTLSFTADHPFLFYIRNKESGTILFLGRYCS
jgi:serpin B